LNSRAIVTGAYGAIGKAIAEGIARNGLDITMVGRDERKLQLAVSDIRKMLPDAILDYAVVDLSREAEIRAFSEGWTGPLDVLINNAATSPRSRTETPEGIEMQWAANVLGYFRMIRYFASFMKGRPDARIVNVASYWAGDLDFDDLEFTRRRYNNDTAYRQSKQADRMLAAAFAEELKPAGITVNACHPGDVNSKLSNSMGYGGSETPEQGADTPVWLAVSEEVKRITGKYFEHQRKQACLFMADKKGVERLYLICDEYSGR
jgi:NAD(P)-dependent dehydrogenase (short-subunit alcohol dehydrogenase family)